MIRNVIVTGGTGFIGGWLIEYLLSQKVRVCAVVRSKERLLPAFFYNPDFTYIEKGIEELTPVDFKETDYDCIYHLAWDGVSTENKNDYLLQLKNINVAMHIMDIAKSIGCRKLISAGTVAEYVFSGGVMDFSMKQTPNDFYGAAKVSTHYFLDVHSNRLDYPYIWAVLPSTFGERRADNNIITYTIRELLNKRIPQYGTLDQMWDFLYISDVVRALYLLGMFGKHNTTYGIGSGKFRTLLEYILTIRDIIDPSLPIDIGVKKYNTKQLMSSCVDINELVMDTGFKPEVSFEEGIKKTILYMKQRMDL